MVKVISTVAILLFSIFSASAQLSNYRDVWIFSPAADNASFIMQKSMLNDAAGLKERDIKVHEIVGFKGNENLLKKYGASQKGFTFILFGKDGGQKLRSHEPLSSEKLYRTIDAMPMRQAEMKRQKP